MKRLACATAALLALALVVIDGGLRTDRVAAAVAGEHDYFNTLSRRADAWKVYSLRDPAMFRDDRFGGYSEGDPEPGSGVTYSPNTDTDRHRQDAAKVEIPAFFADTTLSQGIGAGDTTLKLTYAYRAAFPRDRVIRVDREVMTVTQWVDDYTITVSRGSFASAPAAHAAGAAVERNTNSLRHQVRLPLNTTDDHTYFFTWDGYWTDSYLGAGGFNHKAFQFGSGGNEGNNIWLEPDISYEDKRASCWNPNVHLASFHVRSYNDLGGVANWLLTDGNRLGPGATGKEPLGPKADFCLAPNQWVRFFMHIRQKSNDYDYVDMWLADESQDPVQVLFNVPVSVRSTGKTPNSIQKFWLEFNTSTDTYYRLDNRSLVAYVRNFVALRDTPDPRSLLVRPVPGAEPVSGPAAPRNVRIIQGS
jgi:hypothetical protein